MSILKVERQEKIRQFVYSSQRATVSQLCLQFKVSEATIRRDLDELAASGSLLRTHGGAARPETVTPEPPVLQRIQEQAEAKHRIGRAAAGLIADGETVFISSGSTALAVATHLQHRYNLTVISNSLPVINLLADCPGLTVIVIGGLLRQSEQSMIGHLAELAVAELRADKVIFGIGAIDLQRGLTNDYLPETMTDRAIMQLSARVILVADHTKFGRIAPALVAPLSVVDTVVTDSGLDPKTMEMLTAAGIHLIMA